MLSLVSSIGSIEAVDLEMDNDEKQQKGKNIKSVCTQLLYL